MWDEAFCRREKMPFCMQILSGDDACAPMGQEIVMSSKSSIFLKKYLQNSLGTKKNEP